MCEKSSPNQQTNIDGDNFKYSKGKAEMRLIWVEVENGAIIPMHYHPLSLLGHIASGELTIAKKKVLVKPLGRRFICYPGKYSSFIQ